MFASRLVLLTNFCSDRAWPYLVAQVFVTGRRGQNVVGSAGGWSLGWPG